MIKFCACGWRINIWNFILDSSASAIWYLCYVSAIVLVFCLLFSFCNLVFELSFCKKTIGVIFFLLLLQNLVFRLSFNFCNLVFMFYLCNCFGISSFLQFLQFGICVQFLQKKKWSDILSSASAKSGILTVLQLLQFSISVCLCNFFGISSSLQFLQFGICVQFLPKKKVEWYFVFRFCKIWYFDFSSVSSSASAKFGILTVLQLLQFGISVCLCNFFGIFSSLQFLQFGISFCNLVFLFCLCNCFGISSSLQFL